MLRGLRGLRVDKWPVAIVPVRCTGEIIDLDRVV
jgi:hypothetical protein